MSRLSINELTTYRWSFEEDVNHYHQAGVAGIGVWRQKLAHLEAREAEIEAEHGQGLHYPPDLFHPFTALRMGILTNRARLEWCDETLIRLEARTEQVGVLEGA